MPAAWRERFSLAGGEQCDANVRVVLDIGTEFVKAVIVERRSNEVRILGASRVAQDYSNMEGGAIANIDGVVEKAELALKEAAVLAKVRPREAVAGLAGELVRGFVANVSVTRRNPKRPIGRSTIRRLVGGIQKQGLVSVRKQLLEETGYKRFDVELVNSAVVSVHIDGYRVSNPFGFRGRNLDMTVFAAYAPMVHVAAVRSIIEGIGCRLVNVVAEPYAVASATLTDEVYEFGSLIIDVGGGSTDIALVRNKGILGTRMVAFGGRAFTRSLASHFGISLKQAEELKLDYAQGSLSEEERQRIIPVVERDLALYAEAMALAFKQLAKGEKLPPSIYLCGGGSGLPGLPEVFRREELLSQELFTQPPVVHILSPTEISGIVDDKQLLSDAMDVTPKCLALNSFVEQGADGLLHREEKEAYHGISRKGSFSS